MKDVSAIHDVIWPSVTRVGFLKYGEHMDKSELEVPLVTPHAALLERIRRVQPNLSISQTDMMAALDRINDEKAHDPNWNLKPAQVPEWKDSMAKRLRTLCRHYAQALAKGTGWAEKMKASQQHLGDETLAPTVERDKVFTYGWDKDRKVTSARMRYPLM